jgi:hypothetical protein
MDLDPNAIAKTAPGIVGSFIAMWRLQSLTLTQRLISFACGVACSYWGTGVAVKVFPVMSESLTGFVLGLFGMALVSKGFEVLDEIKPATFLASFFKRKG